MIVLPFTAMDAISGRAGSSENCALQGRPALSFQLTRTESEVEVTWIEPGPGPLMSNGTAASAINADEKRTMIDFMGNLLLASLSSDLHDGRAGGGQIDSELSFAHLCNLRFCRLPCASRRNFRHPESPLSS